MQCDLVTRGETQLASRLDLADGERLNLDGEVAQETFEQHLSDDTGVWTIPDEDRISSNQVSLRLGWSPTGDR